jgi:hypothetical protein
MIWHVKLRWITCNLHDGKEQCRPHEAREKWLESISHYILGFGRRVNDESISEMDEIKETSLSNSQFQLATTLPRATATLLEDVDDDLK